MIVQILEWLLVILPTIVLFQGDYNPWLLTPFYLGFVLIKIIRYLDRSTKSIPYWLYAFGTTLLLLSLFGESYFNLYYHVLHYDKILHFLYAIATSLLFYYTIARNSRHWPYLIVGGSLVIHGLWELFEFIADKVSGTTIMQGVFIDLQFVTGAFADTRQDLTVAMVGMVLVVILIAMRRLWLSRLNELE